MSAEIFYYILLILVSFAVLNTFVMVIFERTREFGMLMALGLRPWQIIGQVQLEAFFLGLSGALIGLVLSAALVAYLSEVGIPLSAYGEGEAAAKQAFAKLQAGTCTLLFRLRVWRQHPWCLWWALSCRRYFVCCGCDDSIPLQRCEWSKPCHLDSSCN